MQMYSLETIPAHLLPLQEGTLVWVIRQDGTQARGILQYARYAPPDYREIRAVSVRVDASDAVDGPLRLSEDARIFPAREVLVDAVDALPLCAGCRAYRIDTCDPKGWCRGGGCVYNAAPTGARAE